MTAHKTTSRRTLRQIFAAPLALAVITAIGLVAALTGDGPWDTLSWIALGIPLVTLVVFVSLSGRRTVPKQGHRRAPM